MYRIILLKNSNGQISDNVPVLCGTVKTEGNNGDIFSAATILGLSWLPINHRMHSPSSHSIALYLYDKYIEESADLFINISHETRKNIYRYFQKLHHANPSPMALYSIFDDAFIEIWGLIEGDSFNRFRGCFVYLFRYYVLSTFHFVI